MERGVRYPRSPLMLLGGCFHIIRPQPIISAGVSISQANINHQNHTALFLLPSMAKIKSTGSAASVNIIFVFYLIKHFLHSGRISCQLLNTQIFRLIIGQPKLVFRRKKRFSCLLQMRNCPQNAGYLSAGALPVLIPAGISTSSARRFAAA